VTTPSHIGRYKVIDRLGQGGMGSLFLAHDPVIDRMLAIKVLRDGVDTDELRARFAREARAAGRLRHPNIVTIFDVGEHEGQPFIAMEYVPGETLESLIHRQVRLPLSRKLKLMEELCDGLAYAHRSGLVHRDIKPANLMVDPEGLLKILDFGIVRLAESGMTQAGLLVGTLPYMSPEQVGGKQVDHRSDIFAVGDVLYEFLTCRQAFPGTLKDGIFHRILNTPPPPIEESCPGLPAELPTIVERALHKDPDQRYQDLAAMRNDLARVRERVQRDEARGSASATDEAETVLARAGRATPAPAPTTPRPTTSRESVARRRAALVEQHLQAAASALAAGAFDEAIAAADEVLLLDAANERAQAIVDDASARAGEQQVQRWIAEARGHLDAGEPTLAAAAIEKAAALRPQSADLGAMQQSLDDLRRELELARERVQVVREAVARAAAHFTEGAYDLAIRAADEALARQQTHAEALDLRQRAVARRDAERQPGRQQERPSERAIAPVHEPVTSRSPARVAGYGAAALLAAALAAVAWNAMQPEPEAAHPETLRTAETSAPPAQPAAPAPASAALPDQPRARETAAVPPPPAPVAKAGATKTEPRKPATPPPPATAPAGAAAEGDLEPIRQRAQQLVEAGEREQALATAMRGLRIKPDDAGLRAVIEGMLKTSGAEVIEARRKAVEAGAPRRASALFATGQRHERDALRGRREGRPFQAIRSAWSARDAYVQAAARAREGTGGKQNDSE
jgi:tetratricopeptide (TPR) repeat protein